MAAGELGVTVRSGEVVVGEGAADWRPLEAGSPLAGADVEVDDCEVSDEVCEEGAAVGLGDVQPLNPRTQASPVNRPADSVLFVVRTKAGAPCGV